MGDNDLHLAFYGMIPTRIYRFVFACLVLFPVALILLLALI
jgi:hypothetical protein